MGKMVQISRDIYHGLLVWQLEINSRMEFHRRHLLASQLPTGKISHFTIRISLIFHKGLISP